MIYPAVSVIIPNYNHQNYLKKRIESVLAQTYQNFEIIIMDDKSQDQSLQIINQYRDHPKVKKIIINEINSGSTFKQWNKGVKEALGTYIWIAESDDYADRYFLETLVGFLDTNPNLGVVYCQSWDIDENENIHGTWEKHTDYFKSDLWKTDFIENGRLMVEKYMLFRIIIPNASAALIRKSVYNEVGGANESFKLNGDWLLWTNILLLSDVAFVAKPLNYFRTHHNNVRRKTIEKGVNLVEYIQGIKLVKEIIDIEEITFKRLINSFINLWFISIIVYKIPLINNIKIYRIIKSLEPDIIKRFLKKMYREKKIMKIIYKLINSQAEVSS